MFKALLKKIAHSSTLPTLGGTYDDKWTALQNLIKANKDVITSIETLSADVSKAAEALRTWGSFEGDDLKDILNASAALYLLFAEALSKYAEIEGSARGQMKVLRGQEEHLAELRQERRHLISEAESIEQGRRSTLKKNGDLKAEADKLKTQIEVMDTRITAGEVSLAALERSSLKAWMGLKFDGLVECSKKATIIGEMGNAVTMEISKVSSEPGDIKPNRFTMSIVEQARDAIGEVYLYPKERPNSSRVPSSSYGSVGSRGPTKYIATHHAQQTSISSRSVDSHAISFDVLNPSPEYTADYNGRLYSSQNRVSLYQTIHQDRIYSTAVQEQIHEEHFRPEEGSQDLGCTLEETETFDCGKCFGQFSQETVAKVDSCGHQLCSSCLHEWVIAKSEQDQYSVTCPLCPKRDDGASPGGNSSGRHHETVAGRQI